MNNGWEIKTLGEITSKIGSGSTPKGISKADKSLGISLIRSLNVYDMVFKHTNLARLDETRVENLSNAVVEEGDVLFNIAGSIARCCMVPSEILPACVNQNVSIIRVDKKVITSEFLSYLLTSKFYKDELLRIGRKGGSTIQFITKAELAKLRVSFPSIQEQQNIVAILDKSFAAIAKATENAEKNLQNARDLLQSYLQNIFSKPGDGWKVCKIQDVLKVKSGDFLPTKQMKIDGHIEVFGGNGVVGKYDKFNIRGSNIVIGRVGARCGNVRHVMGEIWLTDNAFYVSECKQDILREFLAIQLDLLNLRQFANQSAQPVISFAKIKNIEISYPVNLNLQLALVEKKNTLAKEYNKLVSVYKKKLGVLSELKKSILNEAFSGRLTKSATPTQSEIFTELQS